MKTRQSALLKGALPVGCVLLALHLVGKGLMTLEREEASKGSSITPNLTNTDFRRYFPPIDINSKKWQSNPQDPLVDGAMNTSSMDAAAHGELVNPAEDLGVEGLVVNRSDMPENLLPLEHVVANKRNTLPSIPDPDMHLPMRDSPAAVSFSGPAIYDPDSHIPGEARKGVNSKNAPMRWINNPDKFLPRNTLPSGSNISGQYVGNPDEYLPELR